MNGPDPHRKVVSRSTDPSRAFSRTSAFLASALALALLFASVLVGSATANAPLWVCTSGCPYATISAALADAGNGDRIVVGAGAFAGALTVDKDVVIAGAGAGQTIIELAAGGSGSVVTVGADADATISDVTITGGVALLGAGVHTDGTLTLKDAAVVANHDSPFGAAAGIFNGPGGDLTLLHTRVADNIASDGVGGGLYNSGAALLKSSLVETNGAEFVGGGIFNAPGATMTLVDSIVRDNFSGLSGGGIGNEGTLEVRGGTVSDNTAQIFGGGLLNTGEVRLTATGVTGNTAAFGWGGGLYNEGTAALRGSSVTGNTAQVEGGGIDNLGVVDLLGTGVTANTPDDCVGC